MKMFKRVFVPKYEPPRTYTCMACKKKALYGQTVLFDSTIKMVYHQHCMDWIMQSDVVVSSDPDMLFDGYLKIKQDITEGTDELVCL